MAVSAIAGIVLQISQFAILGRLLGPSEFGLMAMMMVVIGLNNAIADFGLGNYLVQKETLGRKTLAQILMIATGMATLLAVVIALSSSVVADYFRQPALIVLLPWLSISIVVLTVNQLLMAVLQRFFAFKQIAIGEIISALVGLVSTVILALSGKGVWSLVIGQIVAGGTRLIFFALPLVVFVKQLAQDDCTDLLQAKGFVFYQTGERLLNYLGWNLDKVIIGRMLGDVGLGLYSVAYQLMMKPFSVLNPVFTRVALPLFVNIRNNDIRLISGYLYTIRIIALLSFPVYMVMAIGAPAIVLVLMGEKWVDSAPILYALSFLGFFFSIGNPIGTLILAKAKPELAFYFNLVSLLVFALAFWIGSHYSALGVAVAFLLSGVIILYPVEFYLRHKLVGMGVFQYLKAMGHPFVAMGIPMMIHAIFYLPQMAPSPVVDQFIMAFSAVAFFGGYLIVFDRLLIVSTMNLIFKGN